MAQYEWFITYTPITARLVTSRNSVVQCCSRSSRYQVAFELVTSCQNKAVTTLLPTKL